MFVYSEDIYITNKYYRDLENKATDANNLSKQIAEYISNTKANEKLKGDTYKLLLRNLEVYQYAFSKVAELCIILSNNIKAANSTFLSYTSESPIGEPIDARKIPEYEDLIKEQEVEKAYCEEIIEENETDASGNLITKRHPRDAARASELEIEIAKNKKILEYLNRLDDESSKAVSMVESIAQECNQFQSNVSTIQVSTI